MPEIHLKQHGFTQSACGPFTKNKIRTQYSTKYENQHLFIKTN